jgi:hypothetical protein
VNVRGVFGLVLAAFLAAPLLSAQDGPTTYVFGTYYRCSEATEERADSIFKETIAPILN